MNRLFFTTVFVASLSTLVSCSSSDPASEGVLQDDSDDTSESEPPSGSNVEVPPTVNEPAPAPALTKILFLDSETVAVPTGGLFLVSEFIGDLDNDGKSDLLADTTTILLGPERTDAAALEASERINTAADLFSASVLDFNGNGVADVLLRQYEGNLPQSRFGGFDLVLDRSDLSTPILFDGINGGRIEGVEPGQENLTFAPVGDLDGDGRDDLAGALNGSLSEAGAAVVILYGAASLPGAQTQISRFDDSAVDRLIPVPGVRFEAGRKNFILPLGDINRDGLDDLALRYSDPTRDERETDRLDDMLIVYGNSDGIGSIPAFDSTTALEIGTRFEASLIQDTAGDINADGVPDLVIGSASVEGNRTIYSEGVLLGEDWQLQPTFSLGELAARTVTFTGYGADFGSININPTGDFNGDGFDDLLVEDANRMILIPAGTIGTDRAIDLNDLPTGSLELRANEDPDLAYTYEFLDGQEDINGDGFSDLLMYSRSTGVRVLFGRALN